MHPKLACPHCGQPALTTWQKLRAGGNKVWDCPACGRHFAAKQPLWPFLVLAAVNLIPSLRIRLWLAFFMSSGLLLHALFVVDLESHPGEPIRFDS